MFKITSVFKIRGFTVEDKQKLTHTKKGKYVDVTFSHSVAFSIKPSKGHLILRKCNFVFNINYRVFVLNYIESLI